MKAAWGVQPHSLHPCIPAFLHPCIPSLLIDSSLSRPPNRKSDSMEILHVVQRDSLMAPSQAHCHFIKGGTSHLACPTPCDAQQTPYACQELDENAEPQVLPTVSSRLTDGTCTRPQVMRARVAWGCQGGLFGRWRLTGSTR